MKEMIKNVIKESINSNYGKNIFISMDEELPLGNILYKYIEYNRDKLGSQENELEDLSEFTKREIINLIIKTNQYVLIRDVFEEELYDIIRHFYKGLFNIKRDMDILNIFNKYQRDIISLLEGVDELKVMNNGKREIDIIPCSEYSPEHQIRILHMDLEKIKEPILDIGCGKSGELVKYLRKIGFSTYGIDREIESEEDYFNELSWFDKSFEEEKWGTIIAHLSFTNHFKREHLKLGDGHIKYAKKYMEILRSLKIGGSFYYSPDLEFIEQFMDKDEFQIEINNIKELDEIKSIKITKKSNLK